MHYMKNKKHKKSIEGGCMEMQIQDYGYRMML